MHELKHKSSIYTKNFMKTSKRISVHSKELLKLFSCKYYPFQHVHNPMSTSRAYPEPADAVLIPFKRCCHRQNRNSVEIPPSFEKATLLPKRRLAERNLG